MCGLGGGNILTVPIYGVQPTRIGPVSHQFDVKPNNHPDQYNVLHSTGPTEGSVAAPQFIGTPGPHSRKDGRGRFL